MRQRRSIAAVETCFLDHGDGEPIVALHGIPTSSALFEPLLPELRGFRLIAPDLLGQGETEVPRTGRLNFAAYSRHLAAFLEDVAPPSFHLVLHDFGGVLGLTWANAHPERVRSVVLLSTTVTPSWRIAFLYLTSLLFGREALRWGIARTLRRNPHGHLRLARHWAFPWTRRRCLRGLDHFDRGNLQKAVEGLRALARAPLVVWGEDDAVFPVAHARAILRESPDAKLITIAGCGHWSPLDAPAEVGRAIREFLSRSR
jgi:haloalkane dehalogenase